jgi:transposase
LENEDRFILDEYTAALDYDQLKLSEIDKRIDELSREAQYADKVDRLKSLRGIDTLSAMILVSEIGDCSRFNSPHELMSYAGLVPSENSSVDKRRQGKTGYGGNRHVRFILVEAAWHYRRKPLIGRNLAKRQQGQPAQVVTYSMRAQQRLYKTYWKLASKRPSQVAVVASARELTGFFWGLMTLDL